MVSQDLDEVERCNWCHMVGNYTDVKSSFHDFFVRVHPSEPGLKIQEKVIRILLSQKL